MKTITRETGSVLWTIDPFHTTVGFSVRHLLITNVHGVFERVSGSVRYDAAAPESTVIRVEIPADSINTRAPQRDAHLRSPDFWDAENHPKITYKSTSAKVDGDDLITVGDLTIKGVSHPVEITWEFNGIAKDPYGTTKAGFEGTSTIKRSDWGITWNAALETGGFMISDKVKLVLEVEADKKA